MAAHPLLNQVRAKSEAIVVDNDTYNVVLSYNIVHGIEGYVVGLKFSDSSGSMDSSKAKPVNGMRLALAVSRLAIQMIKPDMDSVEILGFYLLIDENESKKAVEKLQKKTVYGIRANKMQKALKDKLQYLANLEVEGGAAWIMSAKPYSEYEQFNLLEKELAKQLRVEIC